MHILITGGSGFLGSALTQQLLADGTHQISWVSRHKKMPSPAGVKVITYDELANINKIYDIIINLAGAGIADKRWSDKRKQILYSSRLKPTQAVIRYIQQANSKPKLLISGSAIGWYGAQTNDERLTEKSPAQNHDFAHQLCKKWEQLALTATSDNVPVAIVRTGVVISSTGGMIHKLKLPFSLGVGGKLGSGKQTMSWIGLNDWINAVLFIIEQNIGNTDKNLPNKQFYNLTAPNAINNATFTKAVGNWLNLPTLFSQPDFLLKLLFGEMATLLIDGQNVYPKNLLDMGFEFKEHTVAKALSTD
ncbi:MAG: TIGR01777 family protein [Gammaproteobacteria bacterium]|nr:MAG: TIGR01777 family protein [Gammaproteobacteria bacterium]